MVGVTKKMLRTLDDLPLGKRIAYTGISLWLFRGIRGSEVARLSSLDWDNIWCNDPDFNFFGMCQKANKKKHFLLINDPAKNVTEFRRSEFTRFYVLEQFPDRKPLQSSQLKNLLLKDQVQSAAGLLFFVGPLTEEAIDDIRLVRERAPHLTCILINLSEEVALDLGEDMLVWASDIEALHAELLSRQTTGSLTLALRGSEPIELERRLVEDIVSSWSILDVDTIRGGPVSQEDFDCFLNGEAQWNVFVEGGHYTRVFEDKIGNSIGTNSAECVDLCARILEITNELVSKDFDPRSSTRQLRLFCEQGSGITTSLRAAGAELAQSGYPVLVSNSKSGDLRSDSVLALVIQIQDDWQEKRDVRKTHERRSLPVIFLIDKDMEEEEASRLVRLVAAASREAVFVRAFERDREEIDRAAGVLVLRADIAEGEAIALGAHLREFSKTHKLTQIPTDEEWKAYHAGLTHMYNQHLGVEHERIPHLFLIGLQPFIAERVRDANTLEQYYFNRWDRLNDAGLKKLVEIVAAAGAYNLSIPYDVLRRFQEIDLTYLERQEKDQARKLDLFVDWHDRGPLTRNWYLRIRHPMLGRLLCRAIDPLEGDVPYRPLVPLLKELGTKPDDLWFVENLVARAAKRFKRAAPSFSLETDTPLQRAARFMFAAIPEYVKDESRLLRHHEARYHMHVIHACMTALELPISTTLTERQVREVLDAEYRTARGLLNKAREIESRVEPIKNVYNTHASLMFDVAEARKTNIDGLVQFQEAMDLQERAVEADPVDALSRYQFVHRILQSVPTKELADEAKLEIYSRAAIRYQELLHLHESRQVRNIDPVDAEIQLGLLSQAYNQALDQLDITDRKIEEFAVTNREAAVILKIFRILDGKSLRTGFRDRSVAAALRDIRDEVLSTNRGTARAELLLYRLYTEDPLGRLDFNGRLDCLTELKRKSQSAYLPYWHDEAALLCQLDNLEGGSARFRELRAFRQSSASSWFWLNERVLLTGATPRKMTFVVRDAQNGWAHFTGTEVLIKFQPSQFPGMVRGEAFTGFVRFTLSGMQAVSQRFAELDRSAMGLS